MNSYDDKSPHYNLGGIQAIDVIRSRLDKAEFRGFLKGNALKYMLRLGFKDDPDRELEKVETYIRWMREIGD